MHGVTGTSDSVNGMFVENTSALFRPVVEAEGLRFMTQKLKCHS